MTKMYINRPLTLMMTLLSFTTALASEKSSTCEAQTSMPAINECLYSQIDREKEKIEKMLTGININKNIPKDVTTELTAYFKKLPSTSMEKCNLYNINGESGQNGDLLIAQCILNTYSDYYEQVKIIISNFDM